MIPDDLILNNFVLYHLIYQFLHFSQFWCHILPEYQTLQQIYNKYLSYTSQLGSPYGNQPFSTYFWCNSHTSVYSLPKKSHIYLRAIYYTILYTYFFHGEYDKALKLFFYSCNIYTEEFGDRHQMSINNKKLVGHTLRMQNKNIL